MLTELLVTENEVKLRRQQKRSVRGKRQQTCNSYTYRIIYSHYNRGNSAVTRLAIVFITSVERTCVTALPFYCPNKILRL